MKIQLEIHFLTFSNSDQNPQKGVGENIKNSNNIALHLKTALKTDFGLWEVPELENMQFHFHAFSSGGTFHGPKSVFLNGFLIKCYIITVLK